MVACPSLFYLLARSLCSNTLLILPRTLLRIELRWADAGVKLVGARNDESRVQLLRGEVVAARIEKLLAAVRTGVLASNDA